MSLTDPTLAAVLARRFEDRWLAEMNEPQIAAWADRHGFTLDELAWIQPGYCIEAPMCDEPPELQDIVSTYTPSCDGPDVRALGPTESPGHYCQDGCDGPMRVWIALSNVGWVDATGVSVELWGAPSTTTLDSIEVDVPARESLLVELTSDSVEDIGYGGGYTVHDPDGCVPDPVVTDAWVDPFNRGGPFLVMPEECGGGCADNYYTYSETGTSVDDTGTGVAETAATAGDTSTPRDSTPPPTDTSVPTARSDDTTDDDEAKNARCGCDDTGSGAGLWLAPLLLLGTRRSRRA